MKKMKVDLSQEGLQRFCLHHIEKVILVVAVVLLGLYFWLGYTAPVYTAKNPEQLKQLAGEADRHIKSDASWEKIKEFRQGDTSAHERIQQAAAVKLDVAEYVGGPVLGPRLKTLGLRLDPELSPAKELLARSFRAPMFARGTIVEIDRLGSPKITVAGSEGRRGGGPGDRDEDGPTDREERPRPKEKSDYGDTIPDIQKMEMLGVRPKVANIGGDQAAFVKDIVSVTGIIEFESLWKEYERTLSNAKGYYPPGDKPDFKFMQVERRVDQGDWQDITATILDRYSLFPMGSDGSPITPEVIDPYYYDEILTMAIPPITMADYRPYATHPKVPLRSYVPKSVINRLDGKKDTEELRTQNFFDQQSGNAPAGGNQGDQANQGQGGGTGSGGDRDGQGNMAGQNDRSGKGSSTNDIDELKGSNREPYKRVMKLKRPKAPLKLVRVFDFDAPVGKSVEYRIRLWVLDPNSPTGALVAAADSNAKPGDGVRMGTGGGSGGGVLGDDPGGGTGGSTSAGGGTDNEIFDEKKYTRVAINSSLVDPEVRRRLGEQAKTLEDFKTDLKTRGLDKYTELLRNCRPTEWSEPSAPITIGTATAEFYAGDVSKVRMARVDDTSIPIAEPTAKLVAAVWDKVYNTAIPAVKEIARGDFLNFTVPKAHLIHPTQWDVRVLENAEAKTDALVVDIMGGMELPIRDTKLEYQTPGEILIMDANGNFHVQNNLTDLKMYRHSLLIDDEFSVYGKVRRSESQDDSGDDIR